MIKDNIISAIEEAAGYLDNEVHPQVSYDVYSGMHELLCQIHQCVDEAFDYRWSSIPPKQNGLYFVKFSDDFVSTTGVNPCEITWYKDDDFTMYVMGRQTIITYSQLLADGYSAEWSEINAPRTWSSVKPDTNGNWWFVGYVDCQVYDKPIKYDTPKLLTIEDGWASLSRTTRVLVKDCNGWWFDASYTSPPKVLCRGESV